MKMDELVRVLMEAAAASLEDGRADYEKTSKQALCKKVMENKARVC